MTPQPRDWRLVAEQIRDEKDSNKMMELVIELDCLLERDEKARKHPHNLCGFDESNSLGLSQL